MEKSTAGTYSEDYGEKFQDHILSVLARSPSLIVRYRPALSHTYFFADAARTAAKVLLTSVDEFQQLPSKATLIEDVRALVDKESFPRYEKYVKRLFKSNISDVRAVTSKIIDFGKQQAMVNAVLESADFIEKGQRQKVVPLVQRAMLVGEDVSDIGVDYKATVEQRHAWYLEEDPGELIPTGIGHVDYSLKGGAGRGELFVVLAPPKRGKTTTLINIGFGALRNPFGFRVVHYTLEMSWKKVIRRYDDRLAGNLLEMRSKSAHKYVEKLTKKAERFIRGGLFVKQYPTRGASVSTLRAHLSMLASQDFHPDLIIVDYADIMKPERRLGEMRHEQAGIYEDLRTLAGDYDAAVWTGSQAKVGALEKETLDMGDFAEAFEKAAIMDGGIGFCQTVQEKIDGECRLVLVGLRGAEDGRVIKCSIQRKQCLIRSTGLYELDDVQIPTGIGKEEDDEDDDDDNGATKVTSRVHKAARLKRKVGLKKPLKKKGKKPLKKSGKLARRRKAKVSKRLEDL